MKNKEQIKEYLNNADDGDILELWREYCDANNCYDDEIFDSSEFDEIMSDITPTDIANRIFYGDFNPNHNYFTFNGYANLKSSDFLDELISFDDLAEDIANNPDNYDDNDLQEFLNEDTEEE